MHFHAYLWVGDKAVFDQEWLRRPPTEGFTQPAAGLALVAGPAGPAEPAGSAEFAESELPPIRTAHWLLKSPRLIRGTWRDPQEAVVWLARQLEEYQPRFVSEHPGDTARLAGLVNSATERLRGGGDISYGFYLGRPLFLSIAVVACSPNRAAPELRCPLLAGFGDR